MILQRSTKEIRVAIVVSELRPGGMERLVSYLAEDLKRRDIPVEVVCLQSPGVLAPSLVDKGVPVVSLESHGSREMTALWRLGAEFRRFRATIIHLHDYASLPYAALANLLSGNRPVLFTAHGLLYEGFEPLQKRLRFFSRFIDAISAVSEKVSWRHREYLAWNKPVRIIPNGVPPVPMDNESRGKIREELGCSGDAHLFLAVGNPRPEKGFEDLLDAASLLKQQNPAFFIAIAGTLTDSQYCRDLASMLERLDLGENCRFLGFRPDTAALYSAADSFVLSSRSEGLPMVILEAMTAGLPVISTRVGGIPDAVGQNALLVDPRNPGQLAAGMHRMQTDSGLRHKLAEEGKSHVVKNYGIESMADQYIEWYVKAMT